MNGRTMRVIAVAVALLTGPVGCSSDADAPPASGHSPVRPITATAATSTLFVSPDGNDENAGTETAQVQSITQAAEMAKPGTKIVVADGTYHGSVATKVSGTADARIAFVAANRGGAKIVGDDSADTAWTNTGDYVDIQGFDISGPNTDGLVSGGSYDRILDNSVHGFRKGNCVTTANDDYSLHDIDVIGNITSNCGEDHLDHGIYVSHTRGMVANNISYGNAGYGIHCWHACNELIVTNNLVFDNPEGGIVIGQGDGPNDGRVDADNFIVANNIVVDNGREGIRESGATGANNQFLNNILWQNGKDRILLRTGIEDGTIVQDPDFVDFKPDGSGDYRLKPDSPALGAGVQLGAPPTDIDGKPRPQDGGVDIGIYQH